MTTIPDKPFHRPDELAEYFDVSVRKIYRLIRKGKIQASRIGFSFRISKAEVERLITKRHD